MSLEPIEQDRARLRSKGKLSLIREWRVRACAPEYTLCLRKALATLCRELVSRKGEGAESSGSGSTELLQIAVQGAPSLHTAHRRHLDLRRREALLPTVAELKCPAEPFYTRNWSEVPGARSLHVADRK